MKMKRSDAKPTSITYLALCFGNYDKGAPTSIAPLPLPLPSGSVLLSYMALCQPVHGPLPEQALEANLSPVGEERVVTWVRF